jgi:hypothetical protein
MLSPFNTTHKLLPHNKCRDFSEILFYKFPSIHEFTLKRFHLNKLSKISRLDQQIT